MSEAGRAVAERINGRGATTTDRSQSRQAPFSIITGIPKSLANVPNLGLVGCEHELEMCRRALKYLGHVRGYRDRYAFWCNRASEIRARMAILPRPIYLPATDPKPDAPTIEKIPSRSNRGRKPGMAAFETVTECRRLHESERMSAHDIAKKFGLKRHTVRQWLDYETRVNG